uniref:condensation domain-containing protein n=1 Tax=Paenibacillus sp. JCM 10914 TaxID=1236974 RepID=UPI0005613196
MSPRKLDKALVEDVLGLSPVQHGMLFHTLLSPESELYFEQTSLELTGVIQPDLLKQAWSFVIASNQMLRAVFRWTNLDNPVQVVLKHSELQWEHRVLDNTTDMVEQIESIKAADRNSKFDLEKTPFRIILCSKGTNSAEMIICFHHMLIDGWSFAIILREFLDNYKRLLQRMPLEESRKTSFKEHIKLFRTRDVNSQRAFWQEYLEGYSNRLLLPYEVKFNAGLHSITQTDEISFLLSDDIHRNLHKFIQTHQLTVATFLYTAWGITLQKFNNTLDVVFGTTLSGRDQSIKDVDRIVGMFINTLPIRIKTSPSETILNVLKNVQSSLLHREPYHSTSLVDIKDFMNEKDLYSLFRSIVVIENYPLGELFSNTDELNIKAISSFEMTNYDLTVVFTEGAIPTIHLKYNSTLFHPVLVKNLQKHLLEIIRQMLSTPEMQVSSVRLLNQRDYSHFLSNLSDGGIIDYSVERTVERLFEEQVARTPNAEAVVFGDMSLTYAELNRRGNQLAHYLRQQGVGPESLVAICMDRSVDLIVALLG